MNEFHKLKQKKGIPAIASVLNRFIHIFLGSKTPLQSSHSANYYLLDVCEIIVRKPLHESKDVV